VFWRFLDPLAMHIQRRRHVNPAIQSSSESRIRSAMERGGSDPSAIGVALLSMGRTKVTKRSLSSVAAIFRPRDSCRPLDQISSSEEKVSPNLGLGLGNRDVTV
jgi:hypothetical protein